MLFQNLLAENPKKLEGILATIYMPQKIWLKYDFVELFHSIALTQV